MYKKVSYWEQNTFLADIDFVVIGSGIVGLSAALAYKRSFPKRKVVVVERGSLPTGASTKNAGFACFGSITELVADMEQYGEDQVMNLLKKRWEGLCKLRERVGEEVMEYREYGGYELIMDAGKYEQVRSYIPFFNDRIASLIGQKEVFSKVPYWSKFGFGKEGIIIENKAEGQIHPAKMMIRLLELARQAGVIILNGCQVNQLQETDTNIQLDCKDYTLNTQQVLVATNGFTKTLVSDLALTPARNQVLITAPIPELPFKGCFHFDEGYYYFRNIGNRVLLGGARNSAPEEETTDQFGITELIQDKLKAFLKDIIIPNQEVTIEHTWSGVLGVGPTKAPIIKKMGERIGLAVRLGGMGIAIGTQVGEEGAALFE